ncbi:hypothetical protein Nepgr_027926 [Nepenthes gracilis]|uniref:Pentatricopeptide repeat-containing protein n=1 Tax=Nepenthes gracilis TaxID=150966 RepID=A0AAD3Y1X0_NEPGR|nr:hypothetical protein Nepgr_027926 [Nepenthes gracilis]
MATATICRSILSIKHPHSSYIFKRFMLVSHLNFSASQRVSPLPAYTSPSNLLLSHPGANSFILHPLSSRRFIIRSFSSSEGNTTRVSTKVNFSLDDSDLDSDTEETQTTKKEIDKSKLPPPYDPFNKKPAIEEPEDPKNLQEVFHKMRSEGLINNAVKMFDGLSKDGLTHEALELFREIKDKGNMPDVVAHTAVIEAYANAGQSKEALKVYLRMLSSGVAPNAYTYMVLIKGLAGDGKLADAKKYLLEMMGKGMKPNAGTYTAVFECFVKEQKVDEGREFLKEMNLMGFLPAEKAVREVFKGKRGPVVRSVMDILFAE